MKLLLAVTLIAGLLLPAVAPPSRAAVPPSHIDGVLPSGATYVMDVPEDWNRTVLLYSHGYAPDGTANPAQNAPSDAVRTARTYRPAPYPRP